jgi:hypothetical protein
MFQLHFILLWTPTCNPFSLELATTLPAKSGIFNNASPATVTECHFWSPFFAVTELPTNKVRYRFFGGS